MLRKDLLKALDEVKPGVATKEMVEQTTSFAFIGDRVATYNNEIGISAVVPGINTVMSGAIRAEEMYKLMNKIKKEE